MNEAQTAVAAQNPYVGPRTFLAEEHDRFYGREAEARDLLSLVLAERLVLFYAQSGAGKSSLINTRLRPGLAQTGYTLLPTGRVGGNLPVGLATVDNIFVFNLLLTLNQNRHTPAALAQTTLLDYLTGQGVLALLAAEDAEGDEEVTSTAQASPATLPPVALIIDQFEEILTTQLEMWAKREEFFRQLRAAMNQAPNLWVVLVLREDFVAGLDPYARLLPGRLRTRFYMQRMELAAAQAAIARPVVESDHPFAPGVAAQLAHNLSLIRIPGQGTPQPGQYVEPVHLQVVCYQLWENLRNRPPGPITETDLHEAADVDHALQRFYEATIASVLAQSGVSSQESAVRSQQSPVSERQLRRWFDEQLITPTGTRGLVHQGATHTGGLPNALVQQLPGVLVRTESRAGAAWIELTHDRLVEPIRAANRAWAARNLNPLTQAAQAWRAAGELARQLYGERQLADAAEQLARTPEAFGEVERAFVRSGQAAEKRRKEQRLRWVSIAALLVILALSGLTWWGWRNAGLAQHQLTRLEGERLLKEVRSRKERIVNAALLGFTGIALPTPFVSPLASPLTVTVMLTMTEPFSGPEAIVNEVALIRQLLAQVVAADPTLQVNIAVEEADALRRAATRLVQEGERLAAPGNPKAAGALFQLAFDLHPPVDTLLYVWIAPGEFTMGSSDSDTLAESDEKPQHTVNLAGYWIMRTEVTNAQYARCVEAQACTPPDNQRWLRAQFADHPVTDVDWTQASAYAQWVGGRLPSEAQWEKACRGSDVRLYPWGDEAPSAERLNYFGSGLATWTDVGSYPAGANGLYDMAGNVWEWTADWYAGKYYATSPMDNPTGPEKGDSRTLRGGSWLYDDRSVRCAYRSRSSPDDGFNYVGFRVVAPGS